MKLDLSQPLRDVFKGRGIELFYSHQVEAIDLIRQGRNVLVMTPTASGKSLIYNLPVLESFSENPEMRALYIFPLKGLEQDQVKNLNELFHAVQGIQPFLPEKNGIEHRPKKSKHQVSFAEVYDGDTTPYRRKKIREQMPNVIFTNPDMLREQPYVLAVSCQQRLWVEFRRMRVDEIARATPAPAWHRISVGDGTKGPRVYDWAAARFGVPTEGGLIHWLLIRRSVTDPDDRAYYLSLAPKGTSASHLACAAGQRWAIETCFECAKQEAGLDEYEVRSWVGG